MPHVESRPQSTDALGRAVSCSVYMRTLNEEPPRILGGLGIDE